MSGTGLPADYTAVTEVRGVRRRRLPTPASQQTQCRLSKADSMGLQEDRQDAVDMSAVFALCY